MKKKQKKGGESQVEMSLDMVLTNVSKILKKFVSISI